jgi:hypothetical protein
VHLRGGFVEGGDGLGAGFALDEDGFAECHCVVLLAKSCACEKEKGIMVLGMEMTY